jgi:hypothetical protein
MSPEFDASPATANGLFFYHGKRGKRGLLTETATTANGNGFFFTTDYTDYTDGYGNGDNGEQQRRICYG